MVLSIQTNPWLLWAQIALEHASHAQQHRAANDISAESSDAMISLASCASSLEAFRNQIIDLSGGVDPHPSGAAHVKVVRTLQAVFAIDVKQGKTWMRDLEWLFVDIRNGLVHSKPTIAGPVPHPSGTQTHPDNVLYSVESVGRALDIMIDVYTVCWANPSAAAPDVARYVSRNAGLPVGLANHRATI